MSCARNLKAIEAFTQYFQITNDWAFSVPTLRRMFGKHAAFLNNQADEIQEITEIYNDLGTRLDTEFLNIAGDVAHSRVSYMSSAVRTISDQKDDVFKEMMTNKASLVERLQTTKFWKMMSDPTLNEFAKFLQDVSAVYEKGWYDFQQILRVLNQTSTNPSVSKEVSSGWDVFKSLFSEQWSSYRIDIAEFVTDANKRKITSYSVAVQMFELNMKMMFKKQWITATEAQIRRLIDDMTGKAIFSGPYKNMWRAINTLRSIYTSVKYALWIASGWVMLVNSALLWTITYTARKSVALANVEWELVNELFTKYNVLKSESRSEHFDQNMSEWLWDSLFNIMIDKTFVTLMWKRVGINTAALVKGGWHQMWDMMSDNYVKKQSISMALTELGFASKKWQAEFLMRLRNGTLPKNLEYDLHALSTKFYKDFYTNVSSLALTRSKFARWPWVLFNVLQGYMINKTSQVFYAFNKFARHLSTGEIKTYGDFFDYIFNSNKNPELAMLMMNFVHAWKVANYISIAVVEDPETEKEKRSIYAANMNDYYSSMNQNFLARFMRWFMDTESAYITYLDQNGKQFSFTEAWEVWALSMAQTAISWMLRELILLDSLYYGWAAMVDKAKSTPWTPFEDQILDSALTYGWDVFKLQMEKIVWGIGRFMLLPWIDSYGYKYVPEPDDWASVIALSLAETNKNYKKYSELQSLSFINEILENGPLNKTVSILWNLPVIKWFMKRDASKTMPEYRKFLSLVDNDKVLHDLYTWKWNRGAVQIDNVDSLYMTLTKFDLSGLQQTEVASLKHVMADFNTDKQKEELFFNLLMNKMWIENAYETFREFRFDPKNLGMAKMLAMAKLEIPWSDRVLLSYLAKQRYKVLQDEWNEKHWAAEFAKLPDTIEQRVHAKVVDELYPYMYSADKTAWYEMMHSYMELKAPTYFKSVFKQDADVTKFANAIALSDILVNETSKQWDVNAQFLKNAFIVAGNGIKDEDARLEFMNYTMASIDQLSASKTLKDTMKVGVLAWNVDFLQRVVKDPEFIANNKAVLDRSLNLLFSTSTAISRLGSEMLIADMNEASGWYAPRARQQYASSNGRGFTPSKYAANNAAAKDYVANALPAIRESYPSYSPWKATSFPYNPVQRYQSANGYFNFDLKNFYPWVAQTRGLVSGFVWRYPGETTKANIIKSGYQAARFVKWKGTEIPLQRMPIRYKGFDF